MAFFFDYLSPYSYLGWKLFERSFSEIKETQTEVEFCPVVLSKVIKSHETKGPAEIGPKREFLMRDCLRFATREKIPFNPPKLPFNSLLALRLSLKSVAKDQQYSLISLLFKAAWEEGLDLSDEDVIREVLSREFDADHLIEQSMEKSSRVELKANLTRALESGMFGLPSFILHKNSEEELFWGKDSLKDLIDALSGRDPLSNEEYSNFKEKFQV